MTHDHLSALKESYSQLPPEYALAGLTALRHDAFDPESLNQICTAGIHLLSDWAGKIIRKNETQPEV
jgi:hypothetical protein